jgi:hypothetical protein
MMEEHEKHLQKVFEHSKKHMDWSYIQENTSFSID